VVAIENAEYKPRGVEIAEGAECGIADFARLLGGKGGLAEGIVRGFEDGVNDDFVAEGGAAAIEKFE
jgi:hypothetical protein